MIERLVPRLFQRHSENQSGSPSTAQILARQTSFKWKGSQEWGGYSWEELCQLVGYIATFIGIPPHRAGMISTIFADHFDKQGLDGGASAYCVSSHLRLSTEFTDFLIVLNRSLELVKYCVERDLQNNYGQDRLETLGVYSDTPDAKPIVCHFESVQEAIIWSITEELKHAQIFLTAKTYRKYQSWSGRFLQIMKAKGKRASHSYDTDLSEIAANRVVLRVLAKLTTGKRRTYFRELYQESLSSGHIVMKCIYEPAYIKTGFSPK